MPTDPKQLDNHCSHTRQGVGISDNVTLRLTLTILVGLNLVMACERKPTRAPDDCRSYRVAQVVLGSLATGGASAVSATSGVLAQKDLSSTRRESFTDASIAIGATTAVVAALATALPSAANCGGIARHRTNDNTDGEQLPEGTIKDRAATRTTSYDDAVSLCRNIQMTLPTKQDWEDAVSAGRVKFYRWVWTSTPAPNDPTLMVQCRMNARGEVDCSSSGPAKDEPTHDVGIVCI